MNDRIKLIADEIFSHKNILIVSHVRPDGDTLACAYALKNSFEQKGGKAYCVCSDPVSERLSFLCDSPLLLPRDVPSDFEPTLVVSVDVAARTMLGKCAYLFEKYRSVKIDHHVSDDEFANVNYTDSEAAACSEIIFDMAEYLETMSDRVCELLYAGISFDTGCFKHSNVTDETHLKAAYLVKRGVDTNRINRLLFDEKSKNEIKAIMLTYSSMRFLQDGKVAAVCIDNEMKNKNGLSDDDLSDISQLPIEIKGVRLGITVKEKTEEKGTYKISMRSVPGVDAGSICKKLGGGGHVCAAGGSVKAKDREEALGKVLSAVGMIE